MYNVMISDVKVYVDLESHLEIADTFQEAGTRPIEESPDFLVKENNAVEETLDKTNNPGTASDFID